MAVVDLPFLYGNWTPVAPIDLSRPSPRPAVTPAAAEVIRRANSQTDHAHREIAQIRAGLARDAEQATAVERESAALLAAHVRAFPWL